MSPEKGPWSHSPSVPGTTGTTSWWAMSWTASRSGSVPGTVMSTECPTSSKAPAAMMCGKLARMWPWSLSNSSQSVDSAPV